MVQNFSSSLCLHILLDPCGPAAIQQGYIELYLLRAWTWMDGAEMANSRGSAAGSQLLEELQRWRHLRSS